VTQQEALEPHSSQVQPRTKPAVVIAAKCPEQPDASSHAVVIANVPERMPSLVVDHSAPPPNVQPDHAAGYPLHEVVQPFSDAPAEPLPDPAAVAWLAMSTPDEFEEWSERAAIMEHDGGLSKRHAEVLALGYLFEQARHRQHADVVLI
jgi:hypothetical protein